MTDRAAPACGVVLTNYLAVSVCLVVSGIVHGIAAVYLPAAGRALLCIVTLRRYYACRNPATGSLLNSTEQRVLNTLRLPPRDAATFVPNMVPGLAFCTVDNACLCRLFLLPPPPLIAAARSGTCAVPLLFRHPDRVGDSR